MGTIASQITSLTIVYSTVYSDADQRKYQSSASLAFVREFHRRPVNSPHKWPVTRKMFTFDDVIMHTGVKICKRGLWEIWLWFGVFNFQALPQFSNWYLGHFQWCCLQVNDKGQIKKDYASSIQNIYRDWSFVAVEMIAWLIKFIFVYQSFVFIGCQSLMHEILWLSIEIYTKYLLIPIHRDIQRKLYIFEDNHPHYSDVTWALWRLKSPETWLFMSLSGLIPNVKLRIIDPLWRESIGHRWIPFIKSQ